MKLTEKQQAMYDLKLAGKTREEMAAITGVSINVVRKTLVNCYRKLGNSPSKAHGTSSASELKQPEVAAAAIEAASDPMARTAKEAIDRANKALEEAGVPGKVSEAILRRMRVKYAGVVTVRKQIKTHEMVDVIDKQIDLIDTYIDDKVVAEASLRDLALAKSALIEKRALLRGEPTAIISDHERKKIHELAPALLAEVQRCGLVIEGVVTEKTIGPA